MSKPPNKLYPEISQQKSSKWIFELRNCNGHASEVTYD